MKLENCITFEVTKMLTILIACVVGALLVTPLVFEALVYKEEQSEGIGN